MLQERKFNYGDSKASATRSEPRVDRRCNVLPSGDGSFMMTQYELPQPRSLILQELPPASMPLAANKDLRICQMVCPTPFWVSFSLAPNLCRMLRGVLLLAALAQVDPNSLQLCDDWFDRHSPLRWCCWSTNWEVSTKNHSIT